MENKQNEINKIIALCKKSTKSDEEYKECLISKGICPNCLTQSVAREMSEIVCNKCGTIFEDVEFYQSHGTEYDDGRNRKEIYVPPSTLKNQATPFYGIDMPRGNMTSENRSRMKRLRKIGFYINASYSKNSQVVKKLNDITAALNGKIDRSRKKILVESVLMLYIKLQKKFRNWKKINIYSVLYIISNQLGIKINFKDIYNLEDNKKLSLNKFRRNVNRGTERIFSILGKEEKANFKKFILAEILKDNGLSNISEQYKNDFIKTIDEIYKIYSNLPFYEVCKLIIYHLYKNKTYKVLPFNLNEKINKIIDKNLKGYNLSG